MSDPASPQTQGSVRLEVRGLRKSYAGQRVLNGIDFIVEPGEVFVIMGPSGSGKSVLLKHIIGLEEAESGEILIQGESVRGARIVDKYRLAMVFQSSALFHSLTVRENVGLYLSEHRLKKPAEIQKIATEKLDFLGLKNVRDRFPGELSGGMKKRVAIARALVIEPQLILYDEPTSELDPLMTVTIGEEILSLKRRIEVTSIVVTHDRDLAFGVADRIGMLNEGKLIAVGTPDEIRNHPDPTIHRFLHAEFGTDNNASQSS